LRRRGPPTKPEYRPGRIWRVIEAIELERFAERGFRYLEMITISAVLGVLMSVVNPLLGIIVPLALSVLAGLYISVPFLRWLWRVRRIRAPEGKYPIAEFIFALTLSLHAAFLVMGLQTLIAATVQFDREAARLRYQDVALRQALTTCGGRGTPHNPQCEEEVLRELQSVRQQERARHMDVP